MFHWSITSPACCYHIEPLFTEPALDQVGWVPAIGELYYGLNPISLDDSRITLLERPLVNGSAKILLRLYKVQNHNFA